jgi:hypothetical protein
MSFETQAAQDSFMARGGSYELALLQMKKDGTLKPYVFHEYPKTIRLSHGTEQVTLSTETCKGTVITWTESREIFQDIVVNSEDEEERVLSGGKTSSQLEDERMGLIQRCHSMGIPADPAWSAVRLRRELGDALDAPAPGDNMARLEIELTNLRRMKAMQDEIAELRAQLEAPANDPEEVEGLSEAPGRKRGRAAA